ncbi:MAG: YbaK/EbsC family protein [Rhodospirillales bacterium]
MSRLDTPAVRRVRDALAAADSAARVIELEITARTAQDAAAALGLELGQIVKSLMFFIADTPVMVLAAGDRRCVEKALPEAFGIKGAVRRADAKEVKNISGFSIGGVAPVGLVNAMPVVMDRSLERFEIVYAAAGHPHGVFGASPQELRRLSGAAVSDIIAAA